MIRRSVAAAQLAATTKTAAVARALSVDVRTVAAWRSGQKTPSEAAQARLEELYAIDRLRWHKYEPQPEQAAQAPRGGHTSTPAAAGGQEEPSASASQPRGTLLDPISRLRASVERAQGELERDTSMPLERRTRLLSQLSSTMTRLAKAQAITEEQIVTSTAWLAILESLAKALEPFPEAMRAAAAAIERDATAEHAVTRH